MKDVTYKQPFLGGRFKYVPDYKCLALSQTAQIAFDRIKAKINSGIYHYEDCACFCGSQEEIKLAEMDWFGNYYPVVICKKCGLIRANPRLTKDSYADFYSHEYRSLYGDNDYDKEQLFGIRLEQGKAVYKFISKNIKLPLRGVVFDIGCNMGTMLSPFFEKGYEVMGVDYGIEYIEYGKGRTGLNLAVGDTDRLKSFGKKADLIILNHVLEHFSDIDNELNQIKKIIRNGAYVYISLPGTFWWVKNNCAGDIMGLLQNAHTWQFSLETLKYVMECSGFEFVCGNDEICSIFVYSGIIKRKRHEFPEREFRKVISYLRRIEISFFPRYFVKKLLLKWHQNNRLSNAKN